MISLNLSSLEGRERMGGRLREEGEIKGAREGGRNREMKEGLEKREGERDWEGRRQ